YFSKGIWGSAAAAARSTFASMRRTSYWSRDRLANDALRRRDCRISRSVTTCDTDACNRTESPPAIDLPGPVRARRVCVLAHGGADLGAGPARPDHRRGRLPPPREAGAAPGGQAPGRAGGPPNHRG